MHSRPSTRPMPVMRPAPWIASSYMPSAASGDSSRNGVPGSMSRSTRSRGSSLPRPAWRSRALAGPPMAASARRSFNSADSALTCAALVRNSRLPVSVDGARIAMGSSCARLPRRRDLGNGGTRLIDQPAAPMSAATCETAAPGFASLVRATCSTAPPSRPSPAGGRGGPAACMADRRVITKGGSFPLPLAGEGQGGGSSLLFG